MTNQQTRTSPPGESGVRVWLRIDGLVVFGVATTVYSFQGDGWLLFAVLFLVPDLGMVGYLRGPVIGARTYNFLHTYLLPALVLAGGMILDAPLMLSVALIWFAHIGFDRMLGYGLKLPSGFADTHLGTLSRPGLRDSK